MALKVAMHNWMRPEPIETTISRLARSGYDGIEISGEPAVYDAGHVRSLLEEHGLECWGAVTLMVGGRDLLHEDSYVRIGSIQYVKDTIDMIAALGGKILTVVPSTVGKVVPMGSPEDEWKWAVESLKQCQAHAEEKGVRLGLEPLNRFETYLFNRGAQALALADAVSPECGVCLDAYHIHMEEFNVYDAIRQVGKRLFDFHVADNNRFAAGLGQIDWKKIIATLKEVGYDGALTNEFVAPVDRTPAAPYPEMVERNPVDISPEQLKFIQDHGSSVLTEKFYTDQMRINAETLLPLIK